MQSPRARGAHGKGNVCAEYGCIGGRDLWKTSLRTGVEREDKLETDSLREQSHE